MSEPLDTTPLECLADIVMGQSPDSSAVNSNESGLPFLQGCAEFGRQSPGPNLYCSPPLRVAQPESVLISVRAPVGKTNWADQSYCVGRGLGAVKAKAGQADTHFLQYALENNVAFLHRRSQGSTFSAVGRDDLKSFPIPKYSFGKQQKIATILQTVDEAIEKTEALIEKYGQIKAGMMQDLFTRGLTPDGKLRPTRDEAPELYKETPIGWIPKEWELCTLEDVVHFQRGHDIVEAKFVEGDFPVVSSGGIIGYHSEYTTKGPSVVVGRKGTIGKVHFLENDFWAHDTSLFATNLFDNEPKFIFYLCIWLNLGRFGTKSGSPSLNRNDIHPLQIGRPAPEEQKEIVMRIAKCDEKIKTSEMHRNKLRKQKIGLMHDLLTGKVPVTIETPEATNV